MLHKLVDKVYSINLPKSTRRRDNILLQCHSIGTKHTVWDAIDGRESNVEYSNNGILGDGWNQGAAGLVYTTIEILKDAIENNYDSILILEDDIVFEPEAYKSVKSAMEALPSDWEMFHLATQDYKASRRMGKHIKKLSGSWSCQAYVVNSSSFEEYLEWLELVDRPIDSITSEVFHPKGHSYGMIKKVIKTVPNVSDIRGIFINYNA